MSIRKPTDMIKYVITLIILITAINHSSAQSGIAVGTFLDKFENDRNEQQLFSLEYRHNYSISNSNNIIASFGTILLEETAILDTRAVVTQDFFTIDNKVSVYGFAGINLGLALSIGRGLTKLGVNTGIGIRPNFGIFSEFQWQTLFGENMLNVTVGYYL